MDFDGMCAKGADDAPAHSVGMADGVAAEAESRTQPKLAITDTKTQKEWGELREHHSWRSFRATLQLGRDTQFVRQYCAIVCVLLLILTVAYGAARLEANESHTAVRSNSLRLLAETTGAVRRRLSSDPQPRSGRHNVKRLSRSIGVHNDAAVSGAANDDSDPVISTTYGNIRGLRNASEGTLEFLGVPFAQPPLGVLRFQAPIEPVPWKDTLDTKAFSAGCPQACDLPGNLCPSTTSEDCLYLNVFRPDTPPPEGGWPVYVWVHGGSFKVGAGGLPAFFGFGFASHDVVLVTINYRLGALGFLQYDELEGNFGLSDQRMALFWVQQNIEFFGGNKDQVTLGGESAGAISTLSHIASPYSAGLFRSAIVESGTYVIPFNNAQVQNYYFKRFMEYAGCTGKDYADCLHGLPLKRIMEAQEKTEHDVWPFLNHPISLILPWIPTTGTPQLPLHPYEAFRTGNFNRVPLVIGQNSEEGRLFVFEGIGEHAFDAVEYAAAMDILFGSDTIKVFEKYPVFAGQTGKETLIDVITDYFFACESRNIADTLTSQGVPVHTYLFDYTWNSTFWDQMYWCSGHACHGAELPFVFNIFVDGDPDLIPTTQDANLATQMNAYWASFVSNGTTPGGEWPPYASRDRQWMQFGADTGPIGGYKDAKCDMWDEIGYMRWQHNGGSNDLGEPWHRALEHVLRSRVPSDGRYDAL